jgi:hypothetical protein
MISELDDDDAATWIPESVTNHKVIMKPRKSLMVCVTWEYHPPSLINGNALQLHAPLLLVKYARDKEDSEFIWTKGITIDNITEARRANPAANNGPKIQVR